jgi:autoinducer 2-degrading protein
MYIVCVRIHVKPERLGDFERAVLQNARATRQEPGNLRFDVSHEEADPTRFFLYEAYRTPEDFAAHQKTAHYFAWRDTVADWLAEPRVGVRYVSLFPAEADWASGG